MRCKGTTFFRYTQEYKQNYLFFAFIYIISKITSCYCGGSAPYIQHLIILFWVASDNYRSFNPNKISSLIYIYFCSSPSSVFLFPNKNVLSLELTLIVVLIDANCRYKILPFGQSLYPLALLRTSPLLSSHYFGRADYTCALRFCRQATTTAATAANNSNIHGSPTGEPSPVCSSPGSLGLINPFFLPLIPFGPLLLLPLSLGGVSLNGSYTVP